MIITITNNKGGVLKTTVAVNMACQLVVNGYKVALFDFDNQCNVSTSFLKLSDKQKPKNNLLNLLMGESIKNCIDLSINNDIQKNVLFHNSKSKGQLFLVHGSENIMKYDEYIKNNKINNDKLKKILVEINKLVDYVIVDTPPNINTITKIAIENSDKVIVPFDLNYYSIDGIITLLKNFKNNNINYFLLATKVNKSKTNSKNFENLKELVEINNLKNIHILNTKISYNNLSNQIIQNQHVPQVLSMSHLNINKKYIDEYKNLIEEIS